MIDHVSIPVRDLGRSADFYEAVLRQIGFARLIERRSTVGFGKRYPEFWLNARPAMQAVSEGTGNHVCLRAPTQHAVKAFHETALESGGRDAGAPGFRKVSTTVYYGAFIFDPDGNKVEAVTFPQD